jgi:hypothetical protein
MPTSIPNVARREIMRLRAAVRSRSGAVNYEEVKAAASATLAADAGRRFVRSRAEHMRLLAEWRSGERIAQEEGDAAIALLAAVIKGLHDYVACQNTLALSRQGGGKWRSWLVLSPFLSWLTPLVGWFSRRSREGSRPPGLRRMQFSYGMMGITQTGSVLASLETALDSKEVFERRRQAPSRSDSPKGTTGPASESWKESVESRLKFYGMMAALMPLGILFVIFYFTVYPFLHLPATVRDVRAQLRKRGK